MDKAKILHEAQAELQRHVWGTYMTKAFRLRWVGMTLWFPAARLAASVSTPTANICDTLLKMFCREFWSAMLKTDDAC